MRVDIDRDELLRLINNYLRPKSACTNCRAVQIVSTRSELNEANWMLFGFACGTSDGNLAACEEAVKDFIFALRARFSVSKGVSG
jgi:hypothetical protein